MLILPPRWNSLFSGSDGLVNPFGWPVLGMTALVAYGQASGIGCRAGDGADRGLQQGMTWSWRRSISGTAGLIMAAWIIDRFGIGHGFWIALATAAVIELTAGAMQAVSLLSMHGSVEAFAPFAITANAHGGHGWAWQRSQRRPFDCHCAPDVLAHDVSTCAWL